MELKGEQRLPVTRERVWAALLDTETLRAAIPGCEAVVHEGEGRYSVSVVAAVGPVKARFKGRLQQQDLQPPERYTLSFEGDGGMAGFARGSAEVQLSEAADEASHTVLTYRAQAQIGGRLAQIGSRLVDATAARMSQQFFERLVHAISAPAAERQDAAVPLLPVAAGQPPAPAFVAGAVAPQGVPVDGWSGTVSLTMPGWAWAFTLAAAVLAGWIATH